MKTTTSPANISTCYAPEAQPSLEDLGIHFASARARAEFNLMQNLFCAHRPGIRLAEDVGVTRQMFEHQDLYIIFCACALERDGDRTAVLKLAEKGLQAYGHWDAKQIAGNVGSARWSLESLCRLMFLQSYDPTLLEFAANHLIAVADAQARAADYLAKARQAMREVA